MFNDRSDGKMSSAMYSFKYTIVGSDAAHLVHISIIIRRFNKLAYER